MEAKDINNSEDAMRFVEGVLNDLVEGLITKNEAFKYMGEYTVRIIEICEKKVEESMVKNGITNQG